MKKRVIEGVRKIRGFRFKIHRDFMDFTHLEVSGSLVLLAATIIALILANSPLGESFAEFWHIELAFAIGDFEFDQSLLHWIDDGLMAVFF
ncbi:MAG: Na+/H+ antiporter NhaA, partial [Actinomycetota bacterium]|nr:Na+/H+ antiporter NhaA [Actinomycetota bacterium]